LGRFKIGNKQVKPNLTGALGRVFNIPQPTETPIPEIKTITIKKTAEATTNSPYNQGSLLKKQKGNGVQTPNMRTIPQTGAEMILPLITASFAAGVYLRRRS
jgi:hypothetical protein